MLSNTRAEVRVCMGWQAAAVEDGEVLQLAIGEFWKRCPCCRCGHMLIHGHGDTSQFAFWSSLQVLIRALFVTECDTPHSNERSQQSLGHM